MKPVGIIRFSPSEGPGYLASFLDATGIPWRLIRMDAGDPLPTSCEPYAGIAMMGGPMSVNDSLPWIPPLLELIRGAADADVPLLGHCLGGQMMAKALGGEVTNNQFLEKGWHEVDVIDSAAARHWFGDIRSFTTFQWHYQTFSIPPGAVHVLRNGWCENQAFALGPHIGFQCHIEMTTAMVREWCRGEDGVISAAPAAPCVQSNTDILREVELHVADLNSLAMRIYRQWTNELRVD